MSEESRDAPWWTWLSIPLIYVLSISPAGWIAIRYPSVEYPMPYIYAPIGLACQIAPIKRIMYGYLSIYGEDVAQRVLGSP
ncbi:MAG: hypothetical protein AB7O26_18335 [Planctomycetaceae bacterium]